jgi:hypothetical protein
MNTMRNIPATKQDVETAIEKAVDTIADMIGKGFAHNDTRFDGIDSRLDRIEHLLPMAGECSTGQANESSPQQAAGYQPPKPVTLKTAPSGRLDDGASYTSFRCLAA